MPEIPSSAERAPGRPWPPSAEGIRRFREMFDESQSTDAQMLRDLTQATIWTVGLASGGIALLAGSAAEAAFGPVARVSAMVSLALCIILGIMARMILASLVFVARYARIGVLTHLAIFVEARDGDTEPTRSLSCAGGVRSTLSARADAFHRLVSVVAPDRENIVSDEAASLRYIEREQEEVKRRVRQLVIAFIGSQGAFILAVGVLVGALATSIARYRAARAARKLRRRLAEAGTPLGERDRADSLWTHRRWTPGRRMKQLGGRRVAGRIG